MRRISFRCITYQHTESLYMHTITTHDADMMIIISPVFGRLRRAYLRVRIQMVRRRRLMVCVAMC